MPAASTFGRCCKIHQVVAEFSGELVHFGRASETIQTHFPAFFSGGGITIKSNLREYNGFQLVFILHIYAAAGGDLVHS